MGLNIKKANSVEEWKQDNPQAFEDTGYPQPKTVEERLWDVIGENTQLKQDNYYLRVKLSQIQTILDEYKAYSAK